jgi:hypothetical protein
MAKQTFTTGQVLTAAQMTSLQATALGGGDTTAKVASYVLVAADAGTTVAMNAAGATTITVNTGLFAAGDTVFIQNRGAGACTVTAGTATVATAGSLILPQNDAGILYFTATGAAIFYDYIQAGAVSPLTTKGDLYTFSTSDARLAVGANNTTLVADSSEATGLKWATPASGGKVLQVVSTTKTDTFTLNSATYTDVTGLSASITPSAATSKILVLVSLNMATNASAGFAYARIVRDSTAIAIGDSASSRIQSTTGGVSKIAETQFFGGSNFLDSPATTSSTTYKIQLYAQAGTAAAYINRSHIDNDGTDSMRAVSTITCLEIGA